MTYSYWRQQAKAAIAKAHKGIPEAATLKERKAAIDAAYPFGPRKLHPYKMWLKERRFYLDAYEVRPKRAIPHLSPLERAKRKSEALLKASAAS